jgi:hypothetical protein
VIGKRSVNCLTQTPSEKQNAGALKRPHCEDLVPSAAHDQLSVDQYTFGEHYRVS